MAKGWNKFIDERFDEFFDELVNDIMEQSDGEISKSEARDIVKDYMNN
jgi:polyhydroxyalkanoate synthesis regulator phasin